MKKNTIITLIICLLLVPSPSIIAFSQPINQSVIVRMDKNDIAIDTAVQNIIQDQPDIIVVDYLSLKYALIISRALGPVIWVGHGSDQGIMTHKGLLSWEKSAGLVQDTSNTDIMLSCNSYNIKKFLDSDNVITFADALDANVGAKISLLFLTRDFSYLLDAIEISNKVKQGLIPSYTLRIIGDYPTPPPPTTPPPTPTVGLDTWEIIKWVAIFSLDFVELVVLVHPIIGKWSIAKAIADGSDTSIFARIVSRLKSTNIYNTISKTYTRISKYLTDILAKFAIKFTLYGIAFCLEASDIISLIWNSMCALFSALVYAMARATLFEWLFLGIEFILTIAAIVLSASAIFWMKMAGFIIGLGLDIWGFIQDLND